MPLPKLPENLTDRTFVDYVTGAGPGAVEHTFQMRSTPGALDASDSQQRILAVLSAYGAGSFWAGWRVVRIRFQAAGTTVTLPQSIIPALASFVGTAAGSQPNNAPIELSFQGRSATTGRRVDLSLFGAGINPADVPAGYRVPVTPGVGPYGAVIAALGADPNAFITKDITSPSWYPYVNVNFNSYWERRARLG